MSPDQGHQDNLDKVSNLPEDGRVDAEDERRRVELRITAALASKIDKFRTYRDAGIIDERDSCVVAISGGQFALQAIHLGLPPPVTSVYPFGGEQVVFNPQARRFNSVFGVAPEIVRGVGPAVQRTAFQEPANALISGLIWSRRSIGNFLGQPDDFVFVQSQVGKRPVRRAWLKWAEAYFVVEDGRQLWAIKSGRDRKTFRTASGFK